MPESLMGMAHLGGDEKPARASSMSLAKMAFRKFKGNAEKSLSAQEQRIKINEVKKLMGPIVDKFPVISRHLRARSWNTKKATKMLKATLKWRLEFKPEKIRWRMQAKKAKQLLKARLTRERQIYEMRKRAKLKAAVFGAGAAMGSG